MGEGVHYMGEGCMSNLKTYEGLRYELTLSTNSSCDRKNVTSERQASVAK